MASSLEFNKMLAAILTAGIVASGSGVVSRMLYHTTTPEEPAYPIAVASDEAEGGTAEPEEPAADIGTLLASASVDAGQTTAKKCASCHNLEKGGANKIGPALWGVVGREVGSAPDFSYSTGMADHGGVWDFEALNQFLTNPKDYVAGTKMAFAGLKKPEDRADVILYLHSLADNPLPLPEAKAGGEAAGEEAAGDQAAGEEQAPADQAGGAGQASAGQKPTDQAANQAEAPAGEGQAPTEAAAGGLIALLNSTDVAAGEKVARKCKACHDFTKDGKNKIGPALWGVVGRKVGTAPDFSYSSAMANHGGVWDYATLDSYLANPKQVVPGNKMAFAGLKKEDDRAAVILYLRSLADQPLPLPEKG